MADINMSAEQSSTESAENQKPISGFDELFDFSQQFKDIDFKSILYTGYVRSGNIKITDSLVFECRTLLLDELIKCAEVSARYSSIEARNKAYMVEYLVYSILSINGQPIIMDLREIKDFREKYKREPTAEEQARWVMLNKMPSMLLEFMYMVAIKFKSDFDLVFLKEMEKRLNDVMAERKTITSTST